MLRLKELRMARNISQVQFAKEIGVAQNTLSNWENGNRLIDVETVSRIADYFSVSVDYLLGRDEQKEAPALSEKDKRDIAAELHDLLNQLTNADGLMFDGTELNEQTLHFLTISLERDITTATLLAKQKDDKKD